MSKTNALAHMSNVARFLEGIEHEPLAEIVSETILNGGSTTDLSRLGQPGEAPSFGYMVGGIVKPTIIRRGTRPGTTAWDTLGALAVSDIATFIAQNAWKLSNPWGRATHLLGTWVDESTGDVHLDVAEHVIDRDRALALAAERSELAIFDLSEHESITV
jgi:hypothetical protein